MKELTLVEVIEKHGQPHVLKCVNAHDELMEFLRSITHINEDAIRSDADELLAKYGGEE